MAAAKRKKKTSAKTDYKQWKENFESSPEGAGDVVEKITKSTGIKKAVKKVFDSAGLDCGCDERKTALNELLRFRPKECLNEEEFTYLEQFYNKKKGGFNEAIRITPEMQQVLVGLYNRIMPRKKEMTNCGGCFLKEVYRPLSKVYSKYI